MAPETDNYLKHITTNLQTLRQRQPLIHNITNYVAMPLIANALLALGVSPIMAHAEEELAEIVNISNSLVVNIGTLDKAWLDSMKYAMQQAASKNIPIILDPVGAGASNFRTQACLELLNIAKVAVIRGNASEITALAGNFNAITKGVDSQFASASAYTAGVKLAKRYDCTVVISGQQDFIINVADCVIVENGTTLMTKITAMGCTATAVIGAFCAIEPNYFAAAIAAMAIMGITGELAQTMTDKPGHFQVYFLDALASITNDDIAERLKIKAFAEQDI